MEKQQEISALKKDKRWTLKPGLRPSKHNFGGEEFYGKEVKLIMPITPQFTQYQEQYIVFSIQKQPPDVFCKKDALGDFANSQNTCARVSFLIKLQAWGLQSWPNPQDSVSLRIQSECGKMWTRITPNTDTFYAVGCFWNLILQIILSLLRKCCSAAIFLTLITASSVVLQFFQSFHQLTHLFPMHPFFYPRNKWG